ncbi:hypothetical protein DXG01_016571 [Tephrocybe rancida]|nr:hypothetical protein DXG01_016571 [Tephrocybe rancida]
MQANTFKRNATKDGAPADKNAVTVCPQTFKDALDGFTESVKIAIGILLRNIRDPEDFAPDAGRESLTDDIANYIKESESLCDWYMKKSTMNTRRRRANNKLDHNTEQLYDIQRQLRALFLLLDSPREKEIRHLIESSGGPKASINDPKRLGHSERESLVSPGLIHNLREKVCPDNLTALYLYLNVLSAFDSGLRELFVIFKQMHIKPENHFKNHAFGMISTSRGDLALECFRLQTLRSMGQPSS